MDTTTTRYIKAVFQMISKDMYSLQNEKKLSESNARLLSFHSGEKYIQPGDTCRRLCLFFKNFIKGWAFLPQKREQIQVVIPAVVECGLTHCPFIGKPAFFRNLAASNIVFHTVDLDAIYRVAGKKIGTKKEQRFTHISLAGI
jgi:hypothetical protein